MRTNDLVTYPNMPQRLRPSPREGPLGLFRRRGGDRGGREEDVVIPEDRGINGMASPSLRNVL